MSKRNMPGGKIDEDLGLHRGAATTHVPNVGRHNDCGCGVKCGLLLTRRRPHTGECVWGLQRGVTFNNERSHLG